MTSKRELSHRNVMHSMYLYLGDMHLHAETIVHFRWVLQRPNAAENGYTSFMSCFNKCVIITKLIWIMKSGGFEFFKGNNRLCLVHSNKLSLYGPRSRNIIKNNFHHYTRNYFDYFTSSETDNIFIIRISKWQIFYDLHINKGKSTPKPPSGGKKRQWWEIERIRH